MNIVDYIAIAVIVLIVGAATFYIIRAKRRGQKCVGCPYSKQCGKNAAADAVTHSQIKTTIKNNVKGCAPCGRILFQKKRG